MRGGARGLTAAVAAALLAAGCQGRPPEYFRLATSGSRFESSNGYLFIVLPDPSAHMVRVDVRYPVGSARDPAGKEGLAHLVEHLLFAVEVPRAGGTSAIDAELGRLAYVWNAETALDYTHYWAEGPPGSLDGLLKLETERTAVGCRGLTPAAFEREKEIVVDELRERQGSSGSVLASRLQQALYPAGHPYRHTDTVDSVRRIQPADVCAFLRDSYPLGKAVVVVSGAVSDVTVRASAVRHFGAMPRRNLAGLTVPRPVPPAPGRVRLRADVDELTLLVSWPLPSRSTREYRLLETVADEVPDAIEYFAATDDWGHSPSLGVIGGHYAPQLVVTIALDRAEDADQAIASLDRAMQRAFRGMRPARGWSQLLWRAEWLPVAAELVSRYESIGSRARLLADFAQFDGGGAGLVDRVRELDRADPEEVRAVAERWLDPERARFVVIEPDPRATERVTSVSSFVAPPEVHRVAVDPAEADRPLEVPPVSLAIDAARFRAGGGLDVVVWNRPTSPLVRAALVVDSGTAHEPRGEEGVALLQGADQAFDDHLVYAGVHFGHSIDALVDQVALPLYGTARVRLSEQRKRVLRARLRRALAAPRVRYELDFLRALYGPLHPYARPGLTDASLSALDGERLFAWRRDHVVMRNATLILAGDVDRARLDEAIESLREKFRAGEDSPDIDEPPVTTAGYVLGAGRDRDPLVELEIGFVGGQAIDRDYALRLVLSQVLTMRLSRLREEDALSYGFAASYAPRVAGGLWRLSGKVPAGRAAQAAGILQRTLAAMRAGPDAYRDDFVQARRKLVQALAGSAADSAAVLGRLVLMARFRLPPDFFDRLLSEIARLRIDELHRFLTRELAAERQVFGAFGPRAAAEAAVAAARAEAAAARPLPPSSP